MRKNTLWLWLVTSGLILCLAACGPRATPTPKVEEAPTQTARTEGVATPTPEEAAVGPAGEGELEPNNTFEEATPIAAGVSQGFLGPGDKDYYRIEVPNGGILRVEFASVEEDCFDFTVFDPQHMVLDHEEGTGEASAFHLMSSSSGGTYYLAVKGLWEDCEGGYIIDLAVEMQDDGRSSGDAGEELETAVFIGDGEYTGQAGDLDPADYYQFEATSGAMLEFYADIDAYDFWLVLFDAEGKAASGKELACPGASLVIDFSDRELAPGLYRLQVMPEVEGGKYTIGLTGCAPSVPAPTPSAPTPVAQATPTEAPSEEVFAGSSEALRGLESYRYLSLFRFETEEKAEITAGSIEIEGAYVAPDREHDTWTDLSSGEGVEAIRIGDKAWLKVDAEWMEIPAEYAESMMQGVLIFGPVHSWDTLYMGLPGTSNLVGEEVVNGIPCLHYASSYRGWGVLFGGSIVEAEGDVWIAVEGFPVKCIFTATGTDPEGNRGFVAWSMELTDVNQPISIEPPM